MSNISKKAEILRILSPILFKPSKKILEKSKIFQKRNKNLTKSFNNKNRQLYIQILFTNIKEILKIKKVYKTINKLKKIKPKINITIKKLLRRQIIILINTNNTFKYISLFVQYITNIDRILKNIKSEIMANFVYINY